MKIYQTTMKVGITRTPEFEKKGLATHAVNVGLKCGHDCVGCSTGAVLRCHPVFRQIGESPFAHGYAIVDPSTPDRIARDARRLRQRGLIQLCTLTDAWAPEAQQHQLGRRCLEASLAEPGWSVRILTKNAAVREDFDLISRYRDRVLVGLSVTATPDKAGVIAVLEPHASPISERMLALVEARARGLRTYAMFCPLLPSIADAPEQINRLVQFASEIDAEEIFVEPINARGPGLKHCQEALDSAGYATEAAAVGAIRHQDAWSEYVFHLVQNTQASVRRYSDIAKLRFLLYPSHLMSVHNEQIQHDDAGVVWLGNGPDMPF